MTADQTLITQSPFAKQASEELYPTATIIYHADAERIGEVSHLSELKQSRTQTISRLAPEFTQSDSTNARNIADPYISRKPIQLSLVNGGLSIEKAPELTGNITVNGRLLVDQLFIVGNEWADGVLISMSNRVVLFIHQSPRASKRSQKKHGLLGESDVVVKLRTVIDRVADLQVPVLIRGETGTGKELIAQAIHNGSHRNEQNFVSVNVAAIPESLAISELFGSKKGAFTGATKDHSGYFQQAHNSTLFLDEIGDAPEQVQVALLRTLETGEVTPVGSSGSIKVNVRLLAATDADLEKSVENNSFRSPLLQRLAGFEIRILPLRKRRDDIGRLLIHFLQKELETVDENRHLENTTGNVSFWASFFYKASLFDWPGNIRQLKNIAQQIAIYNRGADFLTIPDHIEELFTPKYAQMEQATPPIEPVQPIETPTPQRRKPSSLHEDEILEALSLHRWDLKASAEHLQISRAALYKIIDNTNAIRTASDYSVEELQASFSNQGGDLEKMVDELKVSKAALKRRLKDLSIH